MNNKDYLDLREEKIKYLVANDVVLYCPKSVANYFGFSYKYIAKRIDKLQTGVVRFSNNVIMLTYLGAYNLIKILKVPFRLKCCAIKQLLNKDILEIMKEG